MTAAEMDAAVPELLEAAVAVLGTRATAGFELVQDDDEDSQPQGGDENRAALSLDAEMQFWRSAGRHRLLSADEERELIQRYQGGDRGALETLVTCNQRLVARLARRHAAPGGLTFLDMVQEGNIGLLTALRKFEPERGLKLSTYATWWIRQSMQRGQQDGRSAVRTPVWMQERWSVLRRGADRLRAALDREPDVAEMAEECGLTEEEVVVAQRSAQAVLSLDLRLGRGDEEAGTLGELLADPSLPAVEEVALDQLDDLLIESLMAGLDIRRRRVVQMRYGLLDGASLTLDQVGRRLGITRERVRQLEISALRRIRARAGTAAQSGQVGQRGVSQREASDAACRERVRTGRVHVRSGEGDRRPGRSDTGRDVETWGRWMARRAPARGHGGAGVANDGAYPGPDAGRDDGRPRADAGALRRERR